jgi:molecular chaperone DnaK
MAEKGLTDYPIGIDFGTCFSHLACFDRQQLRLLNKYQDRHGIPSIFVHGELDRDRNQCGRAASIYARNEGYNDSSVVRYVKQQLLGKNPYWRAQTVETGLNFKLKGGTVSAKDIAAHIFRHIIGQANMELQAFRPDAADIGTAVVTVPVFFAEKQRGIIREAANAAGIHTISILEEPIAAALEYCETYNVHEPVVVYDLGGGTVDAACFIRLKGERNTYLVLKAQGGRIGGVDWDEAFKEYIINRYKEEYGIDLAMDAVETGRFADIVENAKLDLSERKETKVDFPYRGRNIPIEVTREQFDGVTKGLLDSTLQIVYDVAKGSRLDVYGRGAHLVLSGGSSQMPQVQEGVTRVFNELGINILNDRRLFQPASAIVSGAARYAGGGVKVIIEPGRNSLKNEQGTPALWVGGTTN